MAEKHVIKFSAIAQFFADEQKLISRGENAVESGHVENMTFDAELQILRGKVMASMRDRKYSVEIQFTPEWMLESATCTCPRGQFMCHHMAALALFGHYNVSVTDKACAWIGQKAQQEITKKLDDIYPLQPHRSTQEELTEAEIKSLTEKLSVFNGAVGFTWLLAKEPAVAEECIPSVEDIIASNEYKSSKKKEELLREQLSVARETVEKIAAETVGQHRNAKWLTYRKNRITASHFGAVLMACRRNRYSPSLFKRLTGAYTLDNMKAIQWGRQHEAEGIAAFEKAMDLKVTATGLWLHECGFIGASPDGLVGTDAIIEVKCPYKYRDASLIEGIRGNYNYIIAADEQGHTTINKQHEYYMQIQGTLAITQRRLCYLVIWTPKEVAIFEVKAEEFVSELQTIQKFYFEHYIPFITGHKHSDIEM